MTSNRPSTLIVDGEYLSLETNGRILDEEFEVRAASTAREALHILQADQI